MFGLLFGQNRKDRLNGDDRYHVYGHYSQNILEVAHDDMGEIHQTVDRDVGDQNLDGHDMDDYNLEDHSLGDHDVGENHSLACYDIGEDQNQGTHDVRDDDHVCCNLDDDYRQSEIQLG